MISTEREAEILRLFHAEKWRIGTIATQLGIHYSTVQRVLGHAGLDPRLVSPRPSILDPYKPFILETLTKYPNLRASRVFQMIHERGYRGSADHFRHVVARLRPRPAAEAYLRLRTLPGEQAQVDWGHFGRVQIGAALRTLWAFVMVLSWSRQIFLRFYLNAAMPSFLRGHVDAFRFYQGVPRIALYDNLKSAVLERVGDAIRFHPTLLELAKHYRFEPRPVAVARGNEKGRVERAIRYVRDSFFAARTWVSVDDLNYQAEEWATGLAADRRWQQDGARRVGEVFAEERTGLLPHPEHDFVTDERVEVDVGKTPYDRHRERRRNRQTDRPTPRACSTSSSSTSTTARSNSSRWRIAYVNGCPRVTRTWPINFVAPPSRFRRTSLRAAAGQRERTRPNTTRSQEARRWNPLRTSTSCESTSWSMPSSTREGSSCSNAVWRC
jgi:transposase